MRGSWIKNMREMQRSRVYTVGELRASAKKQVRGGEIFVKGVSCGFQSGDEYISYRKGYTTGIFSYSAQGKTQFLLEQLVHMAREAGWKHAIWLTETGKKEEIVMELVMIYLGKSYFSRDNFPTEAEEDAALEWLSQYFFIIDHEEDMLNVRSIYEAVARFEKESGVQIDTVSIDNASNLSREPGQERWSIAEYMNYLMRATSRTSSKRNYHTLILFHLNKPDYMMECPTKKKEGGDYRYHPAPSHYNISGGQQINFLGYQLIGIYRPISKQSQFGIINPETGVPFELNEAHIIVTKSKPKAIGKEGSFTLFFDRERQRYYEIVGVGRRYAGDLKPVSVAEVKEKPKAWEDDDIF